jgi:UDP-N-acetylmuramate: L-alanyl-gamma-D-glutamyl-meso-diaminopimelate ligase
MKVHFIAIGGAVMNNLAIALKQKGFEVTGSDDEIFDPAKSHLTEHGLLPEKFGWFPEKITPDIDAVILGMHAKHGNPELDRALELGLKIYSFPEYLYEQSKDKTRVVIAGSHGKTTITAMVLHVLNYHKIDADYLVGAKLEGFDVMVRLTDAPIIVIEGDEYLTSALDLRPKFLHYKPNIALISGIAWDHINVFPEYEGYLHQFELFIQSIQNNGSLVFCQEDKEVIKVVKNASTTGTSEKTLHKIPYKMPCFKIQDGTTFIQNCEKIEFEFLNTKDDSVNEFDFLIPESTPLQVFGKHNLLNISGAKLVCRELGISCPQFMEAIKTFKGASNRLELVAKNENTAIYKDFAHAPSKLKATVDAVKDQFPQRELLAVMELHTFSSLSKAFLHQYRNSMNKADIPVVFFDPHAIALKKLPSITIEDVKQGFDLQNLQVFTSSIDLEAFIRSNDFKDKNLLMMSSGNFGGINLKTLAAESISQNK